MKPRRETKEIKDMPRNTDSFTLNVTLTQSERDAVLQVLEDARESTQQERQPDANQVAYIAGASRIEAALS